MSFERTNITTKFQATVPKAARKELGIKPGEAVGWHVERARVFVDTHKKVKDPLKVLLGNTPTGVDIMQLLRELRDEIA